MDSSLMASAANFRMPSDSFSTAMRSSLCCQRKSPSVRWIFSRSQALAAKTRVDFKNSGDQDWIFDLNKM